MFQYEELPKKLRIQLSRLLVSYFDSFDSPHNVVTILCDEHGVDKIDNHQYGTLDADGQIISCIRDHYDVPLVLDTIELVMRFICETRDVFPYRHGYPLSRLVDELNFRFRENGVGYVYNLEADRLIRLDSTLLHVSAVVPALSVLADNRLTGPNAEFVAAFDEYKNGHYGDCIVNSCKAFESVLKIICDERRWVYRKEKDTCSSLVITVVQNSGLDTSLSEPLKLIGMLRNKYGAHGSGSEPREVPEHLARYCLNMTASSILYIVESLLPANP